MYLYDFENEKFMLEIMDNLVSINDREYTLNIVLSELNLLLFKNIKKDSVLAAREIHEIPEYELIIKINLNELKYDIDENNTVINYSGNEIILYNFNLKEAL